jgi:hypothetical protein
MAVEAGIYHALWRPNEHGYTYARDISPIIQNGILKMQKNPENFRRFDAKNGWGTYDQFMPWLIKLYSKLLQYPDAKIRVSV